VPVSRRLPVVVLLFVACGREGAAPPSARAPGPPTRDAWWKAATAHASGQERILAPRELRGLLAAGRRLGFDADAAWWGERTAWAYSRILSVDPDDVEANAGAGRRTLQSIDGFAALWERMLGTTVPDDAIEELLDRYDAWVQEEKPVFLDDGEYQVAVARLAEARRHLDRLDTDLEYAALESGLARVRTSALNDYPHVHVRAGPFLVFYAAPDLQRGALEDEAAEEQRLAARREVYRRELEGLRAVHEELLADIRTLYPALAARHTLREGEFLYQWIFADRSWYTAYAARLGKSDQESPYRCGFLEGSTGWAYLHAPAAGEGAEASRLRETVAYLAALQLLRRWGRDPDDPTANRLDRCRAHWMIEGWASWLAARRVEQPLVGRAVPPGLLLHPLRRVVEMRSRLDVMQFREPARTNDDIERGAPFPFPLRDSYTDLAWRLVRHLNADERRASFEAFLLAQVEGAGGGVEAFEEAFGVRGGPAWEALGRAVYEGIGAREQAGPEGGPK
jgi:hypothetical protein